jgi:hypothetical protein
MIDGKLGMAIGRKDGYGALLNGGVSLPSTVAPDGGEIP